MKKKLTSLSLATLALTGVIVPANAAEIPYTNQFTSYTVDKTGDTNNDGRLTHTEHVTLNIDFTIPDNAQAGDTYTVTIKNGYVPNFTDVVTIANSDGVPLATVERTDTSNEPYTFVITTTPESVGLQNKQGTLSVPLLLMWNVVGYDADAPLDFTVNGTTISTGETFKTRILSTLPQRTGTILYPLANPDNGTANLYPVGFSQKQDVTHNVTYTFIPNSPNWKFNPDNISVGDSQIDRGAEFDEVEGDGPFNTTWETDWKANTTIDHVSAEKVIVTQHNVPADYAGRVQLNKTAGVGYIDGNEYILKTVVTSTAPGLDKDGEDIITTAKPLAVNGLGEGETIKPSFTVESYVNEKDADTDKDAHTGTLPHGVTSTPLQYTITIKNTGNVALVAPVVSNGAGFTHTFFDTVIPVGETRTLTLDPLDTPAGSTTWDWAVEANGVTATDPTVTVLNNEKVGDVIVKFIDENDNPITPDVTVADDSVVGTPYDTTDLKKQTIDNGDGTRYELVKTTGNETGKVAEGETVVTYQYKKIGSWVPTIPGVDLPMVPYPFDPANPDNPIVPGVDSVIPHVPGFVPVDPVTGEPLKQIDPNDPTKGYVPPTPAKPGENTIINYVPVGVPDEFTTKQGEPITIIPAENDGDGYSVGGLIDPNTGEEVKEVTIPGEGTYKLNEDGSVTFTPEDGFTGKTTPIEYVPVKNGVKGQPVTISGTVTPADNTPVTPAPETPATTPASPVQTKGTTPQAVTPAKANTGGDIDAGNVLTGVGIMSLLGGAIGAVFARRGKKN